MKIMSSKYYCPKNWCLLWDKQKGKCYYCGLNLKKKYLEEGYVALSIKPIFCQA